MDDAKMIWRVETKTLKMIVDIVKDILLQVWFVFDVDRSIFMMNTDDEKIVTVTMKLNPPEKMYHCRERVVFSLYIQNLFKILRGAPKNSETILAIYKDMPTAMIVRWDDEPYPAFVLQHLTDERPMFVVNNDIYDSVFPQPVKADVFYGIIRDLSTIGKIVTLTGGHGNTLMEASNEFGNKVTHVLPVINITGGFTSRHIIKYIEKFSKPGLDDNIYIRYKKDSPFTCEWNTGFGYLRLSVAALP